MPNFVRLLENISYSDIGMAICRNDLLKKIFLYFILAKVPHTWASFLSGSVLCVAAPLLNWTGILCHAQGDKDGLQWHWRLANISLHCMQPLLRVSVSGDQLDRFYSHREWLTSGDCVSHCAFMRSSEAWRGSWHFCCLCSICVPLVTCDIISCEERRVEGRGKAK